MNEIKERLEKISEIIKKAQNIGRYSAKEVKLIAVSKTKPVEDMIEAYECGIRDFGENYVQEILAKYNSLPSDVKIHMIGHLQTNKVSKIIDKVCMIHSVDSERLLNEIDKQAEKHEIEIMPVLLEVNVAGEESKFGFTLKEASEVTERAETEYPHIEIRGYMTSAPITEDPESNRSYFAELRTLAEKYNKTELSMGMSGDYTVAVEEGATMVRIGTAVFGRRNYNI